MRRTVSMSKIEQSLQTGISICKIEPTAHEELMTSPDAERWRRDKSMHLNSISIVSAYVSNSMLHYSSGVDTTEV